MLFLLDPPIYPINNVIRCARKTHIKQIIMPLGYNSQR